MPGTVLGATDTAVNKRNKDYYSLEACTLRGETEIHIVSKLYNSLEGGMWETEPGEGGWGKTVLGGQKSPH